jgi:hypothetical protein
VRWARWARWALRFPRGALRFFGSLAGRALGGRPSALAAPFLFACGSLGAFWIFCLSLYLAGLSALPALSHPLVARSLPDSAG